MMDPVSSLRFSSRRFGLWLVAIVAGATLTSFGTLRAAEKTSGAEDKNGTTEVSGREIFLREWLPNDPRSHGGDGLGPVFNDTSCVACHNLGGAGGAGPASKNVHVLSAFPNSPVQVPAGADAARANLKVPATLTGNKIAERADKTDAKGKDDSILTAAELKKKQQQELLELHPGFRSGPSVVLHLFGTDASYDAWRQQMTMGEAARNRGNVMMSRVGANNPSAIAGLSDVVQGGTIPLLNPVARREAAPAGNPRNRARQVARASVPAGVGFADEDDLVAAVEVANQEGAAGVDDDLAMAKRSMMKVGFRTQHQQGNFTLLTTERNATSIFGAGLIDSIPEAAIEAAAAKKHKGFTNVKGRVSRMSDGKIGRFGWKAQKATLHDFTMTACAFELGLQTPEQKQADVPNRPDYKAPGLDLTQEECVALVDYLKLLPAPAVRVPSSSVEEKYVATGRDLFAAVGCATCHVAKLGEVDGIYSDLLVHNMGLELADVGGYGISDPDVPEETPDDPQSTVVAGSTRDADKTTVVGGPKRIIGATRAEWRTPPLWGVRDSAPYLHDGRAATIEQAIAVHGGEGLKSAQLYFELSQAERLQLQAFLKTLVAPEQLAAAK